MRILIFSLAPVHAPFLPIDWNPDEYLGSLLLLRLEGLLPVAPYHDYREKTADDGGAENEQDDGNANGPDTGQEERVEEVVVVDEGLVG